MVSSQLGIYIHIHDSGEGAATLYRSTRRKLGAFNEMASYKLDFYFSFSQMGIKASQ